MTNFAATGGVPGPGRIGRVAIGDLLKRAAARFPDRVAVTDGARRVTFTELERDANRFANYLVARGLKPGDLIVEVGQEEVASPADVGDRVEKARKASRKSVLMLVQSGDSPRFVPLPLRPDPNSKPG